MEILPSVRLFKQGYPDHVPHSEFVRRFRLLAGGDATPIVPTGLGALPQTETLNLGIPRVTVGEILTTSIGIIFNNR